MRKTAFFFSALLIGAMLITSCSKYSGYKEADSGLYYKFISESGDTAKPRLNDILDVVMSYGTKDSTLMPANGVIQIQLMKPMFKGDIYEGFAMMHKGDSASFIISADSFFTKIARAPRHKFIDSSSVLYFNVKLKDFMSLEQLMKKRQEENAKLEQEELTKLDAYLKANNITAQPTASGIYFIEVQKGKGPKAMTGQKVSVHYTGTLLDGKKFDSSYDRKEPISFALGTGAVIKGWDEAISMMSKGGKAKVIIPSKMAYGERAQGPIPAFSTLVFDVELVDITK
jgi:FKBP-type peptidyl-prolyl cis-trans isomerase